MATPQEVYDSDMYKSVFDGVQGNSVPLAWFQDVYEALGKVLSAQQSAPMTGEEFVKKINEAIKRNERFAKLEAYRKRKAEWLERRR